MTEGTKRTPLYDEHMRLGAKMVPFAGFEMPIQYSGIIDEHLAVRNAAGIFDVSHMGEVEVRGKGAFDFVQRLVTNDAGKMYDGRAMYSAMCNDRGGIVDDLIVYRVTNEHYFIVINASNIEKDFAWMQKHATPDVSLTNVSDEMALIAIQGPAAFGVVQKLTDRDLSTLDFYHFVQLRPGEFEGADNVFLSHTGYTGESGLEIYCENAAAPRIWRRLLETGADAGLKPAGLGARDTLRLEAGYCLYGNDITDDTNPLEAGLAWVTKLDKGDFVGRDALVALKEAGLARRRVGFVMEDRGIPRQGYEIVDDAGTPIGVVTSGSQSPLLEKGIGMAYVPNEPAYTQVGSRLNVAVRGRTLAAVVRKPPFHKP